MFQQDVFQGPGTGTFTDHTFEILIMLLGAFCIGLWLGWMLWSQYKQQVQKLSFDNQSLTVTADALRTELNQIKSDSAGTEADRNNYAAQLETLHRNNSALRDQIDQLESTLEQLSARNRQLETEIGLANPQEQRAKPVTIPLEIDQLDFSGPDDTEEVHPIDESPEVLPTNTESLPPTEPEITQNPDDSTENLDFSDDLDPSFTPEESNDSELVAETMPLSIIPDAEKELAGMAPLDLEVPITAFDIDNTAIAPTEEHPSLPKRDFFAPEQEEPEETIPFAAGLVEADDLTVVEGIGPKIQELLNQYGIKSYQQLAETDVERLREILSTAGSQLAMHDPGTWPAQANLAANDQWDNLKAIQGFLKGGKKPD
ncbi:MAG: hypothetical protein KGS48_13930 [Bacteroidetes bacterium]|nr:hypothetical protein [Bacteroidota bacterium]